ncbi:MAG: hypothetical protein R2826_07265 [Thermoleophilia bacterium]
MDIDVAKEQFADRIVVRIQVKLTGREANRLFLSGDTLIQLPLEGSLPDDDHSPIPRMSIYLSELAGSREGMRRSFIDDASASQYAAAVRAQVEAALTTS